jgi:excisionase family DNA binding protein
MTPEDRIRAAIGELADALREQLRSELAASRNDPPALVDVAEAARVLGVSRTTMYASILDQPGGVRSLAIGRRRLIARSDLDAFATGGRH